MFCTSARAASWFVDSTAGGAGTGITWGNAWTAFSSINWNSVQPGDTIYISGGPTAGQKLYNSQWTVGKNGTSGHPITIAIKADDPLHNGTAILNGNYIEMSNAQFISFTGNVNGQRHLMIRDFFNTVTAEFANAIMAPNSLNCSFTFMVISNCNNNINLNQSANYRIADNDMWQTRGDCGLRVNGSFSAGYDGNMIENNILEVASSTVPGPTQGMGPDGIQTGNNITIRNNSFRVKQYNIVTSVQHTDMIQAPGAFLAIYNNDFINVGDSCIQLHGWYAGSAHSDVKIYNNVFRIVDPIDPFPQYIRLYNVGWPITDISRLIIANNLFLDNGWQNIETDIKSVNGNPTGSGNMLVNNIFANGSGATGTLFWNLEMSSNFSPGAWTINGNSYYQGGNLVKFNGAQQTCTAWIAGNEPQGVIGQPVFASYSYRTLGNNLHLTGSDTVARNTGITVAGVVGIDRDKDGVSRVVPWDKGPYEYPSSGGSSVLDMAVTSATVAEDAGSIAVVVRRSGNLVGTAGCSYTTANGTATAGVNYTLTAGTVSWATGDGADKTITVPLLNTSMLTPKTFTVTLSSPSAGVVLGQTVTTVTETGVGVPGTPILSGWGPWDANTGVIAAPYTVSGTDISQTLDNNNPGDGGRAAYTFTNSLGAYTVELEVNAPSTGANSIFANMNTEPTTPLMICDFVLPTSGFEMRTISWRGNAGTPDTQEFSPKIWDLAAGTNTLIIRGREPANPIRSVRLVPLIIEDPGGDPVAPTVVSVTSTNVHGYYKTNQVLSLYVTWSTNATVTGTPQLLLNTGGIASYVSGSGTTNHLYTYAVGPGEDTSMLDYASTGALSLNGGTIKNVTTDAVLTLAEPGASGSLAQSVVLIIDTTKPTITVSAATITSTITWQVSYSDANFSGTTLSPTNVTLVATGTATGTPFTSGGALGVVTLGLTNITGAGTVRLDIQAGSGIDLAGNVSDASNTSTEAVVAVTSITSTFLAGYYRTNVVIPITLNWSSTITVTGTPRLLLNTGGRANYVSGSGTANLLFNYVIGAGENTQLLEVSAVELNGGTLKNAGADVPLTLPAAGTGGALSGSKILHVDTTKPTMTVGPPLTSSTNVLFLVTYADLNYQATTLATPNVTFVGSGGVTGTALVMSASGTFGVIRTFFTGNGVFRVDVAAGTAVDLAGNLADAGGTDPVTVASTSMTIIRHGKYSNAIIGAP